MARIAFRDPIDKSRRLGFVGLKARLGLIVSTARFTTTPRRPSFQLHDGFHDIEALADERKCVIAE